MNLPRKQIFHDKSLAIAKPFFLIESIRFYFHRIKITTDRAILNAESWGYLVVLRPRPYDFVTLSSDLSFLSQQLEEQGTGDGAVLGEAEGTQVVTLQHTGGMAYQLAQLMVGNVERIDYVAVYPAGIIKRYLSA